MTLFNSINSLFTKLKGRVSISDEHYWPNQSVYQLLSDAGKSVTPHNAMAVASFYMGCSNLAYDLGVSCWDIFNEDSEGNLKRKRGHIFRLLNRRPNPEWNAAQFKTFLIFQALLSHQAEGYAEIVFDGRGRVAELWPIPSHTMERRRDGNGRLYYRHHRADNRYVDIPLNKLIVISSMNMFGSGPTSIMQIARDTLGLALAMQENSSKFYNNGTTLGGVLETDEHLDLELKKQLQNDFNDNYTGARAAHSVVMLSHGFKYKSTGIDPSKSDYVNMRRQVDKDVARYLRMPPHKVGDLQDAHYNNVEHGALEYVKAAPKAWSTQIGEEITYKLLAIRDDVCKVDLDWLLEGDAESMAKAYATELMSGQVTHDQVLAKRGRPQVGESWANQYWMNSGYLTLEQLAKQESAPRDHEELSDEPLRPADPAQSLLPNGQNKKNGASTADPAQSILSDAGSRPIASAEIFNEGAGP